MSRPPTDSERLVAATALHASNDRLAADLQRESVTGLVARLTADNVRRAKKVQK
jgi:hypothetical protein